METGDCASLIYVKILAGREFEAALSWPPRILSSSYHRPRCATPSAPPEVTVSIGGWRWLSSLFACGGVVGFDLGFARWAFCGAMFFPGGVRPRGHAMFWRSEGVTTFQDFCLKKDASEFGNWEQMELHWTETQDFDPGELKGPPKGFCGPEVWGDYRPSVLFSSSPSGRGLGPAVLQPDPLLPVCLPLVPILSGIRSLYLSPSTVSVKSSSKHLYMSP